MADTDLKIKITTVADVAGSDAAANSLDKINASAKAAGEGVDRAMRAANADQPLSELQKLEFELQKITAEAKVMDAALAKIEAAGGSAPGLARGIAQRENQVDMLMPQISALRDMEAAAKDAGKAVTSITETAPKAAVGVAEMGNALGYAARAANDMTRGGRGMLGNVSHMITALGGGTGLASVAGAAAMGLVMLWPHLKKLWEDVEEPKRIADWAKHLDELAASANKFANENSARTFKDWISSLSAEKETIKSNNESLEKNIALIHARRRAQMEIDNAQGALDLAVIDADTTHTEPQKIAARAAVQARMDKAKEQNRLAEIGDEPDKAARASDKANAELRVAQDAAAAARKEQQTIEAETEALTAKRNLALASASAMGAYQDDLKEAKEREHETSMTSPAERDIMAANKYSAQQNIDRAKGNMDAYTQGDRHRLGNLDGSGKDSEKLRHLATEEADKLTKQAEAAQHAAKEAFDAWKMATERAKIEADAVRESFEREQEAHGIHTGSSIGTAQQKLDAKESAAAARAARDAARAEAEAAQAALRDEAAGDSGAFTHAGARSMDGATSKTLTNIGKQLSNGSTADLRKIQTEFSQVSAKLSQDTAATLQHMLDTLKKQAAEIEIMKNQAKNNR